MIIVDSSSLIAIFQREPPAPRLIDRITAQTGCLISVANYVESGQVLARRRRSQPELTLRDFHRLLETLDITLAPVDETQARVALDARVRYGKGFGHPAKLN